VERAGISDPRVVELLCHLVTQAQEHAFILLDPNAKVLWCNPGSERLFSTRQAAIIGRSFSEIFTHGDRAAGIDHLEIEIAKSEAISEDDRWHLRADGTTFWSSGALLSLRAPDTGELLGFGKIIRDRTDLKAQIELKSNQLEELQARHRDVNRAMTKVSHELRNVIAGIRGTVEILNTPLDNEPLRLKFAGLMHRQLAMVGRLADDLLDVQRAHSGKITLQLETVSLQHELRGVLESFEDRLEQRRLTARLLAPPGDLLVNADSHRLQQIFGNLLDNAIKYTPPEGMVWVKVTTEDHFAVVHVEDTGVGIPHEMLQTIFELFTQVDTKNSAGGLGVGLALVRELVVLHGGSVQAISKGPGEGSEFSVRLPLLSVETGR
jgi:PAS domain S-box-containing protein